MRTVLAALLALLAGACARAPLPVPAAPVPAPRPLPRPIAPPAVQSSDWRDWPVTPGSWQVRSVGRGLIAAFGPSEAAAVFTIRCDAAARAVTLSRTGGVGNAGFTVRTTTLTRTLPVAPGEAGAAGPTATLPADDRLLDAMGFSRGRFVIDTPPLAPLVLPAWPEILRVTEGCRG